jgi:hypothetical protein
MKISEKVADFKRLLRAMSGYNAASGIKYSQESEGRQNCRAKLRELARELRDLDYNIEQIACLYLVNDIDYNLPCNKSRYNSK